MSLHFLKKNYFLNIFKTTFRPLVKKKEKEIKEILKNKKNKKEIEVSSDK